MPENIVQVDLSLLDSEIQEIENEIATLNAKKAIKIGVKEFLLNNAMPKNGHGSAIGSVVDISQYGGISEFITNFLAAKPGSDTRDVITAYAGQTGKKYDDVSNNISNALSRLKTMTKIRSEEKPGGRKAGLRWFKI